MDISTKPDEVMAYAEWLEANPDNRRTSDAFGAGWHARDAEVERQTRLANVAAERMRTAEYREKLLKQDVERLRAALDALVTALDDSAWYPPEHPVAGPRDAAAKLLGR